MSLEIFESETEVETESESETSPAPTKDFPIETVIIVSVGILFIGSVILNIVFGCMLVKAKKKE